MGEGLELLETGHSEMLRDYKIYIVYFTKRILNELFSRRPCFGNEGTEWLHFNVINIDID